MRRCLVALALLGMVACAFAKSGDVQASLPKKGTGRPTCILPVKQLRCTVDTRTGFVAGMRYGYGPIGEFNVCSQGNSFQTTWDMSPVAYRAAIPIFRPAAVSQPSFPNGGNRIPADQLMQYGSLISQVIVLKAVNPLGPKFGTIPAIIFRYTNEDLAAAFAAGNIADPFDFAICGNADYARAYLRPDIGVLPPTPVELQAVYVSPLTEDDEPSFLGSFQAKCSPRGAGYLGGDPQTSSKFAIEELKKVCFAKLAHVVPSGPIAPVRHRPAVSYDWNVPFTPCFFDKKDAKKSASFSCAASGQAVATGKFGVILVDTANGNPINVAMDADGNRDIVPFEGEMYEGDPEVLAEEDQE